EFRRVLFRSNGMIEAGTRVQRGKPIFPRLDIDKEVEAIKAMMQKPEPEMKQTQENVPEQKEEIAFDAFMKLDMRVAEVLKAEKMKNADKLLKLQLDVGIDK